MAARQSKVMTAAEAVRRLALGPSTSVAIGGMHMHNNPMALVRELIRRGERLGRVISSPSASINIDILIGAGLVAELLTAYVGLEHLGLAPHFRRAVQAQTLKLLEVDEAYVIHGLYAGAGGLPFIPHPIDMSTTDIPRINPLVYQTVTDPFTGRTVTALRPLVPDVALVHCQEADPQGNCGFLGAPFTDRLMALAARKVVVQVERVVAAGRIQKYPPGTTLPGFLVDAVVEAPFGCHPTASHGEYVHDEPAIQEYLKASKDADSFNGYLDQYIRQSADERGYRLRVGQERLAALQGEVLRQ